MFSPFEELEYVSDHLPGEGESILISREAGELVCRPCQRWNLREGIHDPELYGLLVQANERLNRAGNLPIWATLLALVWIAIGLHSLLDFDWEWWFMIPGILPLALLGCFQWIRARQRDVFVINVLPMIIYEIQRRRISPRALLAGVRQHAELRTLLDELVEWSPAPEATLVRKRREDTLS